MNNLECYEKFRKVPENAKREIKGGKLNGKTDINPMWRIKVLTEAFGPCGVGWFYVPIKRWTENGAQGEVAVFVDIELYVKHDNEWSKPICGTGGAMLVAIEKGQLVTNDEAYKMANTDAISVAAKQLGIGADVYWQEDATKYTKKPEENAVTPKKTIADGAILKEVMKKSVQERAEEARKIIATLTTKAEKIKAFAAAMGVSNAELKAIVEKYAPDWDIEKMSDAAYNSTFVEIREAAK